MDTDEIEGAIQTLLAARGPGRSICPSEAARRVDPQGWRTLMPSVRATAAAMAARGEIRITHRGRDIDPATARGPIRLISSQP